MVSKQMALVPGIVLLCAVGNASALDECAYRGGAYSAGSIVCQLGIQYRCEVGKWTSLQVRCPENPPAAGPERCEFDGALYGSGAAVCQFGDRYRCEDGVWTSLGVACAGDKPSRTILSPEQVASTIRVTNVQAYDSVVTGQLLNTSGTPVRNVELMIRHQWLWNNERHPGDDSPGRADLYTLPGDIPAREKASFTFQVAPPLPQRSDGRFRTEVQVVGFAQVGE